MQKFVSLPFQYLAYLAFRFAEWFIGCFSLRSCMRFGSAVGKAAFCLAIPYRKLVRRNLEIAYGQRRTPAELDALTQRHFLRLGANFMASIRTSLMNNAEVEKIVSYKGAGGFQRGIDAGNGVVGALTHTANWELYARICPLGEEVPFGTIYQALKNPFINRHIERRRGDLGTRLFERNGGFRAPTEFIRSGGALGVLIDQYPGVRGVFAPLFGRLTPSTTLPALLCLRTGAPLMFVGMQPEEGGEKWKITFHDPIYPPADPAEKESWTLEVTAEMNRKLTETLEENPEEWFWVHDRFKSSGRNVFPQARKTPVALPAGFALNEVTPHYFLLRSPNPLGDACMSIPAVRVVKSSRPDAHVTILCRSNLEELWKQQPEVDDVIAIPGKQKPSRVGELIRERRPYYDTAILFPNSTSSAWETKAGGVEMTYGYAGHHRRRLLRWVIPEPPAEPPAHHLNRYLHMVEQLGGDISDLDSLLAIPDPPSPVRADQKVWRIGLCPGAEFGEAKRWPLERFAEAADLLRAGYPNSQIDVSLLGSPAEARLGEELAELISGPSDNWIGKTSVAELIDRLRECAVVVSNDTGTMHLAAVLGIPTVAIFGSTEPDLTSPMGHRHRVVREKAECSPCFRRTCPIDFHCMTKIETGRVVDEIKSLI